MKKLLTAFLVLTLVLSCSVAIFAGCTPPTDYERTIVFYSSQGDYVSTPFFTEKQSPWACPSL